MVIQCAFPARVKQRNWCKGTRFAVHSSCSRAQPAQRVLHRNAVRGRADPRASASRAFPPSLHVTRDEGRVPWFLLGTRTHTPLMPFPHGLARVWQQRQCPWSGKLGGRLHVVFLLLFLVGSSQFYYHRKLLLKHLFCVAHGTAGVCVCVYNLVM